MRRKTALLPFLGIVSLMLVLGGCGGKTSGSTPYGDKRLNPATAELLNDPLYQNIILPDELAQRLARKEEVYVYFFSPLCPHCKSTTPVVVPIAKELGIDLKMYNVLEFEQGWTDYNIKGTPTIVHFVDGEEKDRLVGGASQTPGDGGFGPEDFRQWFQSQKE